MQTSTSSNRLDIPGRISRFFRQALSAKPSQNGAEASLTREANSSFGDPLICRIIFDELCVLANGDIVCSCADPAGLKVYGNVHRDRIVDIYNGANYQAMRESQLYSVGKSWCPVVSTNCSVRISRPTIRDRPVGRSVRMLQLEPISYCNLRCPACPTSTMSLGVNPAYRTDRQSVLPLQTMLDVVDQLPDLEKLLFYNFGEPFIHPQSVAFLREVRRRRPDVTIHTSTNGIVLKEDTIRAIAEEALIDRIVFSIDGASTESYARYRVRGKYSKAIGKMQSLAKACDAYGTRNRVEIIWQYILFEWNDSESELQEARRVAEDVGIEIQWIVTHTEGASQRFLPGSHALASLMSGRAFNALTCDMRAKDWRHNNGISQGSYHAQISASTSQITCSCGDPIQFAVRVTNTAPNGWNRLGSYRLGVQLQTPVGRQITEYLGYGLPERMTNARVTHNSTIDLVAPAMPGRYDLFLDVVHDGVCWFSDRGSQAQIVELEVLTPATPD